MSISALNIPNGNSIYCQNLTVAPFLTGASSTITTSTTASTSSSTGALIVSGGMAVKGSEYIGGSLFLPSTGGTATALTYFEELAFSYAFTGAYVGQITGKIVRLNDIVWIYFDGVSGTASADTIHATASVIPARFIPQNSAYCSCLVMSNSTMVNGTVLIQNDGNIIFYVGTASNFSASGNDGVMKSAISYKI